ncbi:MAG TPA: hypothetical protein VGL58_12855 [Caulobacteraceae bacterium]|jgi:hypothetical protein
MAGADGAVLVADAASPAPTEPLERLCDCCRRLLPSAQVQRRKFPILKAAAPKPRRRERAWLLPQWICDLCWGRRQLSRRNRLRLKATAFLAGVGAAATLAHFLIGVSGDGHDPWRDTGILLVAYALAMTSLWLSYEAGGRVWVVRHALINDGERTFEIAESGGAGLSKVIANVMVGPLPGKATAKSATPAVRDHDADRRLYRGWVFRRSLTPPHIAAKLASASDGAAHKAPETRAWRRCLSGFWGEALIVSIAIAVCIAVVWLCERSSIIHAIRTYRVWIYGLAVAAVLVIADYSARQVESARKAGRSDSYCARLEAAYSVYWVYAWFLFAFGAVILGVLWLQFLDAQTVVTAGRRQIATYLLNAQFDAHSAALLPAVHGPLVQPGGAPTAATFYNYAMSYVELAYRQLSETDLSIQKMMDPVFVFSALLILVNIGITHTSLRHLFTDDGRKFTFVFTYGPLVLVVLVGGYVFKATYETMMTDMANGLLSMVIRPDLMTPDAVRRHAEVLSEVNRGNNIFGFAAVMGGSGSAAAVLGWFLKEVLDRVRTRQAIVEAGGQLLRRPHPRFRPTSR